MTDITFDTLHYVAQLEESGFTRKQAEVQAKAVQEIWQHYDKVLSQELSTKADIKELELKIKELELRLTLRLGAIMAASVAVVAAIVKF